MTEQWVSFLNFLLMLFTLVSAQFMGQMSLGLIGPIEFEHWTLKHSDWLVVGRSAWVWAGGFCVVDRSGCAVGVQVVEGAGTQT